MENQENEEIPSFRKLLEDEGFSSGGNISLSMVARVAWRIEEEERERIYKILEKHKQENEELITQILMEI